MDKENVNAILLYIIRWEIHEMPDGTGVILLDGGPDILSVLFGKHAENCSFEQMGHIWLRADKTINDDV